MILKTSDGGDNWYPQASGTTFNLNDVAFSSLNDGVIVGEASTLHFTSTGGNSWTAASISGNTNQRQLNGVDFSEDGSTAFAVGDDGLLLSSTNPGNWSLVSLPSAVGNTDLNAIELKDQVGYIVGDEGMILKSEDCLDPFNAWTVQQADNNEDWAGFTSGQNSDLNDVWFVDRETGYAVGNNGLILKTISGSDYWTARVSNTTNAINTIHLQNPTQGFLGGNDAYLHRLNDGTDRFSTRFWYDRLGRLVASQNAKQFAMSPHRYSYTGYDELGRIVEVGELASNTEPNETLLNQNNYPDNWNPNRTEVTQTVYDLPISPQINAQFGPLGQEYLRNRVATILFYDNFSSTSASDYRFASHYSYDIHGNVKVLLNENRDLTHLQQQFKRIEYDYDLVSGNVNEVRYQPGQCDQFYHRYHYDADNRIDSVWTSTDAIQWDMDARYNYYQHGPLARVELGDLQVQGVDYSYTLQGWIKGVNSNSLDADKDIGKDGLSSGSHQLVARDAYGLSLNYHQNDYQSIDPTAQNFLATITGTPLGNASNHLYNGNISKMVTSLTDITGTKLDVQGMAYQYDQLNRLVDAAAFASPDVASNNSFAGVTDHGDYHTEYTYDANGNIESLLRNGVSPAQQMDDMRYRYTEHGGEKINNRLHHVNDPVAATHYPNTDAPDREDIDDQGNYDSSHPSDWNYDYDEIGNLIQDKAEEIQSIEWTVYGKIKKVMRTSNNHNKADLEFAYGPSGNRILKLVKPRQAGVLQPQDKWKYTYYVRDASGNIMATYQRRVGAIASTPGWTVSDSLQLGDFHLYGSKRLGTETADRLLSHLSFSSPGLDSDGHYVLGTPINTAFSCTPDATHRLLGSKQYELSNHLGNVLATISDRKIAREQAGGFGYFDPHVQQYSDYYAFGMLMPGRNGGAYRFGFNGMERDDELKGDGNSLDFGARVYDSRLGRWLAVDRYKKEKPNVTPYSYVQNTPLFLNDPDGNDGEAVIIRNKDGNGGTIVIIATYYIIEGKVENSGFSKPKIHEIENLNDILNKQSLKVPRDVTFNGENLNGYNIKFDLNFVKVTSIEEANSKMNTVTHTYDIENDGEEGLAMIIRNNIIKNVKENKFNSDRINKETAKRHGADVKDMLGATGGINNQYISLKNLNRYNTGHSFQKSALHEIFHTLFFNKDGSYAGIGAGKTLKPTENDVMELINSIPKSSSLSEPIKPASNDINIDDKSEGSCFVTGTKILLRANEQKNIEKIVLSDSILVFDFTSSKLVRRKVINLLSPVHKNIIEIQFSDNTSNQNTFDHSYYTKAKGWASYKPQWTRERYHLDAKQLEVGDTVFKAVDGELKEVIVTLIEEQIGEVKTYNIIAEGGHNNYFANGILVHNETIDSTNTKASFGAVQGTDDPIRRLSIGNLVPLPTALMNPYSRHAQPPVSVAYYEADVLSYSDYYPFGMMMPGRQASDSVYRFGFSGMERDDEMGSEGINYNFKERIYSTQLGRFFSIDPLANSYPTQSPYSYAGNMPIIATDPSGKQIVIVGDAQYVEGVKKALAQMMRTKEGLRMVSALTSTKNNIIINYNPKAGKNKYFGDLYGQSNYYINFNPNDTEPFEDGTERRPETSLAHEFAHYELDISGNSDSREVTSEEGIFAQDESNDYYLKKAHAEEIIVVDKENKVRAGLNMSLRTNYSGIPIIGKKVSSSYGVFYDNDGNKHSALFFIDDPKFKPNYSYLENISSPIEMIKVHNEIKVTLGSNPLQYRASKKARENPVEKDKYGKFYLHGTHIEESDKVEIISSEEKNKK